MSNDDDNVVKFDGRRKKDAEDMKLLDKKWGKGTMGVGYTVLPVALLRGQARLKIGINELAVLVHLIDHWWKPEGMPYPKKQTIAERLGVSQKTVQRAIVNLEREGLLLRNPRPHRRWSPASHGRWPCAGHARRRGSLADRRTPCDRGAEILRLEPAGRHQPQGARRRHQGQMDLRTGASTTQGGAWPRPFRGAVLDGTAPTRTDGDDRLCLSAIPPPQGCGTGKKELPDRPRNQPCRPSGKPSSTPSRDRHQDAALIVTGSSQNAPGKICQSSAILENLTL